jgi:hypothetical protein
MSAVSKRKEEADETLEAKQKVNVKSTWLNIYRTPVTGLSHHNYGVFAKDIEPGEELELRPDPANKFDPLAVGTWYSGEQIGWIPAERHEAKEIIYKMLHGGLDLTARVVSHDLKANLQSRLYVAIYVRIVNEQ